jgi:tight adherence protein B
MIVLGDVPLSTGFVVLIGAMAGVGIWLMFLGIQRAVQNRSESLLDRMNKFGAPVPPPFPDANEKKKKSRQRRFLFFSNRRRVLTDPGADSTGRSYTAGLARDLARADIRITVGEYFVMVLALAGAGALIGLALPIGGHILLAVILIAAAFFVPRRYVTIQKQRRQRAFNSQLSDVITMIANTLRSGFALLQSLELVSREAPSPINQEFERVVREVGFGTSVELALSHLVDRMESEDLELLVTAINVQREVGGNLVEVLDGISATIRDRVRLVGEVRTLTAQQQYSGYIIALLPVGLALMLSVINPGYMLGVFKETTWCGWTMLSCSLVMIIAGFLIIRQIVQIKV